MKNKLSLVFLMIVAASCTPHRSFVASPYEPVMVEKKGDVQLSAGFRAFKYLSTEATCAVNDYLAIRAGYGGFFGLDIFSASTPFFKNYEKFGFFVAPGISYQHNVINRQVPTFFANNQKTYKYNCEYLSPLLAMGVKFEVFEGIVYHISLKTQYNVVQNYDYYYQKHNGSGKSSSFEMFDEETYHKKLDPFFSLEPSFAMTNKINEALIFKCQLGLNIVQRVSTHRYSFRRGDYGNPQMIEAVTAHPRNLLLNLSFGIIFNSNISWGGRRAAF